VARFALDYVPNGTRDYRATPKTPGSFTRGNRNSTFLGREATRGLLASVGNPANPTTTKFFKPPPPSAETARKRIVDARARKLVCPGCGIERPMNGDQCNQCW
jgi:hypothetical protein